MCCCNSFRAAGSLRGRGAKKRGEARTEDRPEDRTTTRPAAKSFICFDAQILRRGRLKNANRIGKDNESGGKYRN
jgi:hypothetical protein